MHAEDRETLVRKAEERLRALQEITPVSQVSSGPAPTLSPNASLQGENTFVALASLPSLPPQEPRREAGGGRGEAVETAVQTERAARDGWRAATASVESARKALGNHEREIGEQARITKSAHVLPRWLPYRSLVAKSCFYGRVNLCPTTNTTIYPDKLGDKFFRVLCMYRSVNKKKEFRLQKKGNSGGTDFY